MCCNYYYYYYYYYILYPFSYYTVVKFGQILVNDQLDALFSMYLFHASTCFEQQVLIIRRIKLCQYIWTIKARDSTRITAAEMKCVIKTAGCIWTDYDTNTETAKEIITPVLDKIQGYRRSCVRLVNRRHLKKLPLIINNTHQSQKERLRWSRGSVPAFSTQVRGFKPCRSRRTFKGEKTLSMPSFGGEVTPSVPCRRFAACKRTLNVP
jgi:hypothetical protein